MRRSSFEINGTWENGYWSLDVYKAGDFYKSKVSEKLFVVTKKFDGEFKGGGEWGNFYQMRDATEKEILEYNKPYNPEKEKDVFDLFLSALDN